MPVPAEVNWREPRLRISTLPMESLLFMGEVSGEFGCRREGKKAYCSSSPETT